ncbi:MAG TPA: hypothetical protein VIB49_10420 [Thermoplasmata archaeon]|jgi:hypothetical protein
MGRAEALIALGISLQLVVIAILLQLLFNESIGALQPPTGASTWWLSVLGLGLVIVGAWMKAWEKKLAA